MFAGCLEKALCGKRWVGRIVRTVRLCFLFFPLFDLWIRYFHNQQQANAFGDSPTKERLENDVTAVYIMTSK